MSEKATLKRVITLPLLVFYGVGTILGAGIYALIGKIAGLSGIYAPFSFLLSALIASFVAFSYAELSSRYPQSAGEAVYVYEAFSRRWLATLVGWGIVITGIVSSAVMARGFHGYLNEFLYLPDFISISIFVLIITAIAVIGVSLSVKVATVITLIEISGIVMVLFVTREHLFSISDRWLDFIPPFSWEIWQNIIFGAFLSFFAFIGFEDMVNVAEEVIEPEQNLPIAIIIALVTTTIIYAFVAIAAVSALSIETLANHDAPFALIIRESSNIPVSLISLISLIAILNGALVQIIMGSRVLYGMASKGVGPKFFQYIHPKTRTPVTATVFFSTILLLFALWLPIELLAKTTSFIILIIFALVNLSLSVIKWKETQQPVDIYMRIPVFIPAAGFLLCVSFILLQFK